MTYRLTAEATRNVATHIRYTRKEFGERVALELRARFQKTFASLADLPRQGRLRPDLTTRDLYFFPVVPFFVVYRIHPQDIEITSVLHAARDVPTVLSARRD